MRKIVIFVSFFWLLYGCGGMKPEDFAAETPALDLFAYFEGQTEAWGLFEDRFGRVRRQFKVDIEGTVDGDVLTLDEIFQYADGESDRRVWQIRKLGDGRFEGRAGDVIGIATGTASGNALNWRYQMNLNVGDDVWRVNFDDWMFLQPDGVMINRATVTKWGLEVGQVTLFFRQRKAAGRAA